MSTRPIREALARLEARLLATPNVPLFHRKEDLEAYNAALEAVAAIENMAKTLVPAMTEEIRACRMPHAAALLESIAKEAP